jgi:adenylate kinase family enzyme
VVIVGGPGSGKSTAARALASDLGFHHVEADALWWEPEWRHVDAAQLQRRVLEAVEGRPRWVVDGNYISELAEMLWPAADTLMWMAAPRRTALRRAVSRTLCRVRRRELLWGTNRESLSTVAPRNLMRLWRRWPDYDRRIRAALAEPSAQHLNVVRLSSAREAVNLIEEP